MTCWVCQQTKSVFNSTSRYMRKLLAALSFHPFSLSRPILTNPSPKPSLETSSLPSRHRISMSNDYFAAYPTFTPDPHTSLLGNFKRLARAQGWDKDRRKNERQIYLTHQYDIHLGSISTGKLQKWQGLCQELGVDPIPTSITKCKKVRCPPRRGDKCVLIAGIFHFLPRNMNIPAQRYLFLLAVCYLVLSLPFGGREKINVASEQLGSQDGHSCQYHRFDR